MASLRIKIKEPNSYDVTHDVKLLGSFYWDVEQYLEHMGRSLDAMKVNVVTMFLKGIVKLWWRTRA